MKRTVIALLTVVTLVMMMLSADVAVATGGAGNMPTATNETQTATNETEESTLVADFDFELPCSICGSEAVQFTDHTTGGTEPYQYDWDFGDGSEHSTIQNAEHAYASAGAYNVTLTVTDRAGDTANKTKIVPLQLAPEPSAETENVVSPTAGDASWPRCNDGCTANDATIVAAWLVADGNCSPGDGNAAELWARFDVQRAKGPWCIVSVIDIYLDGVLAYDEYATAVGDLPGKGQYDRKLGDVTWPCGAELEIRDIHVQWHNHDGDLCLWGDCSHYKPSKCWETPGPFYVPIPLVADFAFDDICFCNNTSFTDTTTGGKKPYTYSWDFGGGYTYNGDDPAQLQNPVIHYNELGTYTVTLTVTDSDCPANSDSQSYDVTVYPNPTANAGEDAGFCDGGSVKLSGSAAGGTPPYTYDWTGPENHPNTQNPTASTAGTYTLTVIDANGCTGSDSVVVTVYESPTCHITADPDTEVCAGVDVTLTEDGGNAVSWYWTTSETTSSITVSTSGTYGVTITDAYGCTSYCEITVEVTVPPVAPAGGGGGCPATKYLTVDWEGNNTTKPLYRNDRLTMDLLGPSSDVSHSLLLKRGTHAPTVDGRTHYLIVIREIQEVPALPENLTAIVVFNITPVDAAFDTDIFLTIGIDELPANALNVTMNYYDDFDGVWVPLEYEAGGPSGVAELTLSAPIDHFSIFGVLAELAPPSPLAHFKASGLNIAPSVEKTWERLTFMTKIGEIVSITATVTNDGGQEGAFTAALKLNGQTVDTQTVTLAAGQTEQVSFTKRGLDYGQYDVDVAGLSGTLTVSRSINWWLIIGLIAAMGLIIWGVVWRRRRRRARQQA